MGWSIELLFTSNIAGKPQYRLVTNMLYAKYQNKEAIHLREPASSAKFIKGILNQMLAETKSKDWF